MTNVIIGFSKPKKWKIFAALIMWFYDVPYDHVYVKFYSKRYDRDLIYQASKMMVNFMSPSVFEEENVVIQEFTLPISAKSKKKAMQFAIDNAGKPYGILECLGLAWIKICANFGHKVKNPFGDGRTTYVCSELGAFILRDCDLKLPDDPENLSPKDLYDFLTELSQS